MTFRSSGRAVALCALLTLGCGVLTVHSAHAFFTSPAGVAAKSRAVTLGGATALLLGSVYATWLFWTSRVTVEAGGVRWQEGKERGFLAWDAIQGFGHRRAEKTLRIGLVEKATGEIRFLPVMNADLYRALLPRCGPLPTEIVREAGLG